MISISIVIVSWNACKYLQDCLSSIQATADGIVKEIIVVDNASTDGSPEMVLATFPHVKLIRSNTNLGFARANNIALSRFTGDYVALINSDVIVHPDCLQTLLRFMLANPRVGLSGPKVFGGDGNLQRSCGHFPTLWNTACRLLALDRILSRWRLFSGLQMRHWDYGSQVEVEVLSGCFWLARRKAIEEVGPLDERFFFYAEDVDWCKRFKTSGWKAMYVPDATATHFGGGSSSNATLRFSIEMMRAGLLYWKKHHGNLGRLGFYLLAVLRQATRLVLHGILRIVGSSDPEDTRQKFKEDAVCLRWLLTGRGV